MLLNKQVDESFVLYFPTRGPQYSLSHGSKSQFILFVIIFRLSTPSFNFNKQVHFVKIGSSANFFFLSLQV
jgi:hypothetical protein